METAAIRIRYRTRTATCDGTLSLCGRYDVSVEPAFTGDGFLVLHDRTVLPKVWPHCPDAERWAAPFAEDGSVFAWAKLKDGKSERDDGEITEDGTLDLRDEKLVRKLTKLLPVGTVADVPFSVYEDNGLGGMNMAGTGTMKVLVSESYTSLAEKKLILFKGDKGDEGEGGKSAYDIAVKYGYSGTEAEWLQSLKGDMGLPASIAMMRERTGENHLWHKVALSKNDRNQWVMDVDQEPSDGDGAFDAEVKASGISTTQEEIDTATKIKARSLSERFADIVNIKDFGAVGNGVHDDTEAFKDAWEYVMVRIKQIYESSASKGIDGMYPNTHACSLYLPRGRYLITEPNFLNTTKDPTGRTVNGYSTKGARIFGDGMFASQILFAPETDGAWMYDMTVTENVDGVDRYKYAGNLGFELNNIGIILSKKNTTHARDYHLGAVHGFRTRSESDHVFQYLNMVNCLVCGTEATIWLWDDGKVTASENRFVNCRFVNLKTLLKLQGNREAVNQNLINTDVEQVCGDIIDCSGGHAINWFGGSVIFKRDDKETTDKDTPGVPVDYGECAVVNFGGSPDTGEGDEVRAYVSGGQVSIYGIRCEFKSKKSRLLRCEDNYVNGSLIFENCSLSNIDWGQDFAKVAVGNGSNIAFYNCTMPRIDGIYARSDSTDLNKPYQGPHVSKFLFVPNDTKRPSTNESVDNKTNQFTGPNRCSSVVVFRDCMGTGIPFGYMEDVDVDYYCDYGNSMEGTWGGQPAATSVGHVVIYDNCRGLPSVFEYASAYRSGLSYLAQPSSVSFIGYYFPYIMAADVVNRQESTLEKERPRLYLPQNAYLESVTISGVNKGNDGAYELSAAKIAVVVDKVVSGATVRQEIAVSEGFNSLGSFQVTIPVNKVISGDRNDRTIKLCIASEYLNGGAVKRMTPRSPSEWSAVANIR